jgi:flavin reductase (DIM6/NTAB) family NADH-FMN oxidoreductase RutF
MSFTDREFRDALGQFTTGVCVVTAEVDGILLGATVSSFNSVSLAPPLILFSLARSAQTLPLWLKATHFGVTVLAESQTDLSNRFARGGAEKWNGRLASGLPQSVRSGSDDSIIQFRHLFLHVAAKLSPIHFF